MKEEFLYLREPPQRRLFSVYDRSTRPHVLKPSPRNLFANGDMNFHKIVELLVDYNGEYYIEMHDPADLTSTRILLSCSYIVHQSNILHPLARHQSITSVHPSAIFSVSVQTHQRSYILNLIHPINTTFIRLLLIQ